MASFIQKIRTLATHRDVRRLYARWTAYRLAGKQPVVKLDREHQLYSGKSFSSYRTLVDQCSSWDEFAVFRKFLGPGAVFFDVGANLGVTTVLAARMGSSIRIVAFEPTSDCAVIWRKNVEANGIANAALFECALGEESGRLEFVSHKAANYNRLNVGNTIGRHATAASPDVVIREISVTTVDAVCMQLQIRRISLLKIDVEGAEPAVLRGARSMLEAKAINAIFLEFVPAYMRDMNEDVTRFVETMALCGYHAFEVGRGETVGRPLQAEELVAGKFNGPNVIFLPQLANE